MKLVPACNDEVHISSHGNKLFPQGKQSLKKMLKVQTASFLAAGV
jgi:hypothetical protein